MILDFTWRIDPDGHRLYVNGVLIGIAHDYGWSLYLTDECEAWCADQEVSCGRLKHRAKCQIESLQNWFHRMGL